MNQLVLLCCELSSVGLHEDPTLLHIHGKACHALLQAFGSVRPLCSQDLSSPDSLNCQSTLAVSEHPWACTGPTSSAAVGSWRTNFLEIFWMLHHDAERDFGSRHSEIHSHNYLLVLHSLESFYLLALRHFLQSLSLFIRNLYLRSSQQTELQPLLVT